MRVTCCEASPKETRETESTTWENLTGSHPGAEKVGPALMTSLRCTHLYLWNVFLL